ncbi:hypothetical protein PHMEG_0006864 [Phytophthora megakarya]|uniref:Uncharacterized protein n=1 Tax=Phytophthora megakarya TaxID=4795 RepID=A0A225WMW0_9STRA|nr:hypothetical protein PHMEG_0006864 [Phytophthora megakarya]
MTVDRDASDDDEETDQDISINLLELDLNKKVTNLIQVETWERKCLQGKVRQLESLVCSVSQISRSKKQTSINSMLGVLMKTDAVERRRGKGNRERFNYYLLFVGAVCRPSFTRCLDVTQLTVQQHKTHDNNGNISAKSHKNFLNKNAAVVDVEWLVNSHPNVEKDTDGRVKEYYSSEKYTLLPTKFTWNFVYDQMEKYIDQIRAPARSTMRKLLALHCSHIRIRSKRSNVCDLCTIYQSRLRGGATAEQTEAMAVHITSAREYKKDRARVNKPEADPDVAVIVMDFSQNLTVPSVTSTPSQ